MWFLSPLETGCRFRARTLRGETWHLIGVRERVMLEKIEKALDEGDLERAFDLLVGAAKDPTTDQGKLEALSDRFDEALKKRAHELP